MRRRAALAALLLVACSGPAPRVQEAVVQPGPDGRVSVVVVLENRGGGEGEVSLIVTLRVRETGAVVGRTERGVTLRPHERLRMTVEMRPAAPGDLVPEVEARYPPE